MSTISVAFAVVVVPASHAGVDGCVVEAVVGDRFRSLVTNAVLY